MNFHQCTLKPLPMEAMRPYKKSRYRSSRLWTQHYLKVNKFKARPLLPWERKPSTRNSRQVGPQTDLDALNNWCHTLPRIQRQFLVRPSPSLATIKTSVFRLAGGTKRKNIPNQTALSKFTCMLCIIKLFRPKLFPCKQREESRPGQVACYSVNNSGETKFRIEKSSQKRRWLLLLP
jgi:hypothetical protein